LLNSRPAKQFAPGGQQRGLVIALRLAQPAYFKNKGGVTPVLLCDDVLGELDPERRARFWASLEGEPQFIATGTSPPADAAGWQILSVEGGQIADAVNAPSSNFQTPETHRSPHQPENARTNEESIIEASLEVGAGRLELYSRSCTLNRGNGLC